MTSWRREVHLTKMNRIAIITVGLTHSGKTTFAHALEKVLNNSIVIDQDNHAEFLNRFYEKLLPKQGANTLKYAITKTIVDYAVEQTDSHLILCNSNRNQKGRRQLLSYLKDKDFTTILVHFNIPEDILRTRIAESSRNTAIFRSATTFEEVLDRQQAESSSADVTAPSGDEADYLFVISDSDETQGVIDGIINLAENVR